MSLSIYISSPGVGNLGFNKNFSLSIILSSVFIFSVILSDPLTQVLALQNYLTITSSGRIIYDNIFLFTDDFEDGLGTSSDEIIRGDGWYDEEGRIQIDEVVFHSDHHSLRMETETDIDKHTGRIFGVATRNCWSPTYNEEVILAKTVGYTVSWDVWFYLPESTIDNAHAFWIITELFDGEYNHVAGIEMKFPSSGETLIQFIGNPPIQWQENPYTLVENTWHHAILVVDYANGRFVSLELDYNKWNLGDYEYFKRVDIWPDIESGMLHFDVGVDTDQLEEYPHQLVYIDDAAAYLNLK